MRFVLGFVAAFFVLVLGSVLFVQSGIYNAAATEAHSPPVEWLLHTTMEQSVASRSQAIEVPEGLGSKAMVQQGAQAYDQLCAACHLKPGKDSSLLREGLNPTPPNLTEDGHFEPAEHFWVIKNGIRMTGMPAWGETHADEELWEITAFLQELPKLSEAQYKALVRPPEGSSGMADDGHDHDHSEMAGMMAGDSHHDAGDHHSTNPDSDGSSETASDQAAEDDHYSDGHTH